MIEIIKKGKDLNDFIKYTKTCKYCGCEFTYSNEDIKWKSDNCTKFFGNHTAFGTVECPWCKYALLHSETENIL